MKENSNTSIRDIIISIIKGVLCFWIVSLCTSLILTAILMNLKDPVSYLSLSSAFTICISFISGSLLSSYNSSKPVFNSIIYIFVQLLLILLITVIFSTNDNQPTVIKSIITYFGAPLLSILVVFLSNKQFKKKSIYKKLRSR
ncbi:MAG: hypothetical protein IKL36_06005 [Clostridia bacterium]|nr:hypothetical protein [Clostridia bacterium]